MASMGGPQRGRHSITNWGPGWQPYNAVGVDVLQEGLTIATAPAATSRAPRTVTLVRAVSAIRGI